MVATAKNNLELAGIPKRRGRPATGQAKSNAERQANFRAKREEYKRLMLESTAEICAKKTLEKLCREILTAPEESQKMAWAEIGRRKGWLI